MRDTFPWFRGDGFDPLIADRLAFPAEHDPAVATGRVSAGLTPALALNHFEDRSWPGRRGA